MVAKEGGVRPPRLYGLGGRSSAARVGVDGAGGVGRISARWSALIFRLAMMRVRWQPATSAKVLISSVSHKGRSGLVLRVVVKSDSRPQVNWEASSQGVKTTELYSIMSHPFLKVDA